MAITAVVAASPATNTSLRSITDYVRLVRSIGEDVEDLASLFQVHRRALAGVSLIVGDEEVDKIQSPLAPSTKTLKLVVPDLKELEKNYGVVAQLHAKLEELRMIEADVEIRFGRDRDLAPSAQKIIKELNVIKNKLVLTLENAYKFLQKVAHARIPNAQVVFLDRLAAAVSKSIQYQSVSSYLYVYPYKDSLAFSSYLHLQDTVDLSGKKFGEMFIVTSFLLSSTAGKWTPYLATLNKFQAPGTFPLGKEVPDIKVAIKVLSALLDLDNFENDFNRLPLNQLIDPASMSKWLFTLSDKVASVEPDEDALTFHFKRDVNSSEKASKLAQQLNVELQVFTRRSNAKLRMKIDRKPKGGWFVSFFFIKPADIPVTTSDLAFLKERFNLTPSAVERICNVINRE